MDDSELLKNMCVSRYINMLSIALGRIYYKNIAIYSSPFKYKIIMYVAHILKCVTNGIINFIAVKNCLFLVTFNNVY